MQIHIGGVPACGAHHGEAGGDVCECGDYAAVNVRAVVAAEELLSEGEAQLDAIGVGAH